MLRRAARVEDRRVVPVQAGGGRDLLGGTDEAVVVDVRADVRVVPRQGRAVDDRERHLVLDPAAVRDAGAGEVVDGLPRPGTSERVRFVRQRTSPFSASTTVTSRSCPTQVVVFQASRARAPWRTGRARRDRPRPHRRAAAGDPCGGDRRLGPQPRGRRRRPKPRRGRARDVDEPTVLGHVGFQPVREDLDPADPLDPRQVVGSADVDVVAMQTEGAQRTRQPEGDAVRPDVVERDRRCGPSLGPVRNPSSLPRTGAFPSSDRRRPPPGFRAHDRVEPSTRTQYHADRPSLGCRERRSLWCARSPRSSARAAVAPTSPALLRSTRW